MSTTHLLLVDDEEQFLSTTKKLLEKRGIHTDTCTNGFDALEALEKSRIDVVILDVKMPGLDGVEALRKIKQRYPLIEVIMLTGHASVESAVQGLRLGAFDYLVKPATVEEIVAKVRDACDKKRAKEEQIRSVKIDRMISHPMAIFEKEEE